MILAIRSNYGDESIALIEMLREQSIANTFEKIYVVYVNTGWEAHGWQERVSQGEVFVKRCGFETVQLYAKASFSQLALERNSFPSKKFQWCAGFLKGLPFLDWLDETDPSCSSVIALPKRQALYRKPISEYLDCPYHGERKVWHPMLQATTTLRDVWIKNAGFPLLNHRSLECDPCVNSTSRDYTRMDPKDIHKMRELENRLHKKMIIAQVSPLNTPMDGFTMGCGDPFGCGL